MRTGSEGAGMEVFGVTGHRRASTAPTGRRAWERHMAALGCALTPVGGRDSVSISEMRKRARRLQPSTQGHPAGTGWSRGLTWPQACSLTSHRPPCLVQPLHLPAPT